jgi:acyl phosphate:glycerol-3-phosphate acyltransferase
MILPLLLALVVGYLLGSLPFGVWVARAHGVDIFKVGSGNPGATNVKRSVGKKAGNLVFFLDFLKGVVATVWPSVLVWLDRPSCSCGAEQIEYMAVAGMVGAIVGHSFSCFIGFRGGKGVATSIGGLLALNWQVALIGVAVWVVAFYATRYVSLGSVLLAASLPVSAWLLGNTTFLTVFFAILGAFIIIRHRTNIQRLLAGTESKFAKKKPEAEAGK